ncbi:uncharacterized protein H6S33_007602 [Morchella sextelata]|uniref:uncharacterized protein n=1 Tax=Morchella sextelata TaxID=1174677 RepID=UPI001D03C961|nr:uncharacterized protein H6S33_007602 [Morchella sextelata]KAH0603280.1 hypothetical protein H6S33_007602 [Morchella sextelata]
MFGDFRYLLVWCCALLTVGAVNVPVLITERRRMTNEEAIQLTSDLFGTDDYSFTVSDERVYVESADRLKHLEYDTVSGGITAADDSEPWSPAAGPPGNLPSEPQAMEMAIEITKRLNILPADGLLPAEIELIIKSDRTSGTYVAHEYSDGAGGYIREDYLIDVSAFFDISIKVPDYPEPLLLTGGGGKFKVAFGSNCRLKEFQALWRPIVGSKPYEIMPQEEADRLYQQSLGALAGTATNITSFLAYYSEPFGTLQKLMYPMYVYEGNAVVGDESIPIRPQATRGGDGTGSSHPGMKQFPKRQALDDAKLFEAASEWLGEPYGLTLAKRNADGFRNGVQDTAPLGVYRYEKSNKDVLESDFVSEADTWADTVDMLFYTGHANRNGWMVAEPGTGAEMFIDYRSFGAGPEVPGDLLGQQDLEWLIIAACGPHQDQHINPSDGNVFDRWRGIFDGLHIMFGYATASVDSSEEGGRFMKYAQEGDTLINAWFRAAKELQTSEVIVSAMWTDDAWDDHLPGYGCVSSDNTLGSQERWIMWTTC